MNWKSFALLTSALLLSPDAFASDPNDDTVQSIGLVFTLNGEIPSGGEPMYELDIDADGDLESIVPPAFGGALLAVDLDGNGSIGLGSELFGVSTGEPFAELAAYDSTGDGIIDVDDDSYYALMAWTPESSQPGSAMELRSLDELGIEAISLDWEPLTDGGQAAGYLGSDSTVGFLATVDVSTFDAVPAVAGCKKGHPKGTCNDERVAGNAYRCKKADEGVACTNNLQGAGTCKTDPGIQNVSFCNCTGSERSPVLDGNWTTLLGAVLACLTSIAALRSRG
jgi:hypothetical protein